MPLSQFPPEILTRIVDNFKVDPSQGQVALPSADASTRALVALTRVSRSIHVIAIPQLYAQCMYMEEPRQLHTLCYSLLSQSGQPLPTHLLELATAIAKQKATSPKESQSKEAKEWRIEVGRLTPSELSERPASLPLLSPHRYITSMFLQPFTDYREDEKEYGKHDNSADLAVIQSISCIFNLVQSSLKVLLFDMYTTHQGNRYGKPFQLELRTSLLQLKGLRKFFSMKDPCYVLNNNEWEMEELRILPVWSQWKTLEVLSLRDGYLLNKWFWSKAVQLPALHTVVLCDPIDANQFDIPWIWRQACEEADDGERPLNIYILQESGLKAFSLVAGPTPDRPVRFGWHNDKVVCTTIRKYPHATPEQMLQGDMLEPWTVNPWFKKEDFS